MTCSLRKLILLGGTSAAAFLFGFVSQLRSAETPRFDHTVRNAFFAGFGGNKEALQQGMKACEDALAENPNHAEALVWHGGGLFFLSNTFFKAGDYQKGTEYFNKGMGEMDRAVELAPDRIAVRVPRGATLLTATRFLGQHPRREELLKKGLEDYSRVYELQKTRMDTLSEHSKGELLFGLAEGWSRAGDSVKARTYFEQIASDLRGTAYAERANVWFEKGSIPLAQTGCVGCHVNK
ncbi:MAG TPA: hypothetical protein VE621_21315 [Bryobacteraceae bacterium]|nr:hypothetical protein [Bryobacteraceae bacterium]